MAIEHPTSSPCYCAYDVPVAVDQNMESLYKQEALLHNAKDSHRFIVGPMPVPEFLRRFLKVQDVVQVSKERTTHPSSGNFFGVPDTTDGGFRTARIYEPLLKALKDNNLCPGFGFRQPSEPAVPKHELGRTEPHICCYAAEQLATLEGNPSPKLGYAELFIDVSYTQPNLDYFCDQSPLSPPDFVSTITDNCAPGIKDKLDKAWGQHISYVTEVFARQHRVFFFTVAISGHFARLLRWDRAGCIVTQRFDIRTHPELLVDFLKGFSKLSKTERGHDATVGAATSDEEAVFRDAIAQHVKAQLGVEGAELEKAVAEHYLPGRVSAMHVLQQGTVACPDTVRRYLVSRPVISPLFLDGRGTRGFWAVDASTNQVAFLKDTWRFTGYPLEGDILEEMNAKGVRNIPSLLYHGEVPDVLPVDRKRRFEFNEIQSTETDEYCHDSFVCFLKGKAVSVAKLVHYRVVLGTVGYSLKRLRGTEELLHATFDVLQAMADARNKDSRIHRDLSMGNIILVAEEGRSSRRGYLIDWDVSCEVDDTGASIHRDRPGTWEYMSLAMMDHDGVDKDHRQTLEDDMESLLYVIIHCGLLWLPHNLTDAQLDATIDMFFTSRNVSLSDTEAVRQEAKERGIQPMEIDCGLQDWLFDLLDHFSGPEPPESGDADDDVDHAGGEADERPAQEWKIENLEKFWEEFLQTHTLGRDDRVVHNHPRATGTSSAVGGAEPSSKAETAAAAPTASESTPSASSVAKGKRRAEEPAWTGDLDTPTKRARLEEAAVPSSSAKGPASVAAGSSSSSSHVVSGKSAASSRKDITSPVPSVGHSSILVPSTSESPSSSAVLGKRGAGERDPSESESAPEPGPSTVREQKRFRLDISGSEVKLQE
ncbi:hypothetical protein L226DRAFT_568895 [Lentinus tigrinus ALCF2SS1-7]|uniref:Fungal-type protein kinase domain-containing protein n=1 Tax=Lentinus tigrinus ALCF2SS1-6 TaxID=1328759 RepID=A0A5C2SGL0_9APHY|nr:hypothetical protein L227DRAFT_573511 [Lentinus tigrinus ALCF2SS1-6]RPD77912.1 hypothetical protein L226DRAFT_568895 [Lentinus tigrinus ALCF2SS1-7]